MNAVCKDRDDTATTKLEQKPSWVLNSATTYAGGDSIRYADLVLCGNYPSMPQVSVIRQLGALSNGSWDDSATAFQQAAMLLPTVQRWSSEVAKVLSGSRPSLVDVRIPVSGTPEFSSNEIATALRILASWLIEDPGDNQPDDLREIQRGLETNRKAGRSLAFDYCRWSSTRA